jgi:hypothetical protein
MTCYSQGISVGFQVYPTVFVGKERMTMIKNLDSARSLVVGDIAVMAVTIDDPGIKKDDPATKVGMLSDYGHHVGGR